VVATAYAPSRFYQEFHLGLQQAPPRALPVLTKSDMMAHFGDVVADPTLHLSDIGFPPPAGSSGSWCSALELATEATLARVASVAYPRPLVHRREVSK
jgi:hypothetical protein